MVRMTQREWFERGKREGISKMLCGVKKGGQGKVLVIVCTKYGENKSFEVI